MGKRYWLVILGVVLLLSVMPVAAQPPVSEEQALALLRDGKRHEALRALDAIIASHPPDPGGALFAASRISLEDGDWRAAQPYARQLVKLRPSSFQAWELMVQVDQAAGSPHDRDLDIQSLYESWHAARDPQTRSRVAFVRDRIVGPAHTLIAVQALDPGGDNIVRFVFQPVEEGTTPLHLIEVRSDDETNERWREDGTVPYGTIVYHLDTIEQLGGGASSARSYEFYLEAPDYDRVRARVVEILAGTAQPMNGEADPFWAGASAK